MELFTKYPDINADLACDAVEEYFAVGAQIEDFVPMMYEEGFDMAVFEN